MFEDERILPELAFCYRSYLSQHHPLGDKAMHGILMQLALVGTETCAIHRVMYSYLITFSYTQ